MDKQFISIPNLRLSKGAEFPYDDNSMSACRCVLRCVKTKPQMVRTGQRTH